jgi:hypothetical protein
LHNGFTGERGGHWDHGWHGGRYGWWWGGPGLAWTYYDYPSWGYDYPASGSYPDYDYYGYSQPYGYGQPSVYGQPSGQTWYYCSDPAGYYPNVTQCNTTWQYGPAS